MTYCGPLFGHQIWSQNRDHFRSKKPRTPRCPTTVGGHFDVRKKSFHLRSQKQYRPTPHLQEASMDEENAMIAAMMCMKVSLVNAWNQTNIKRRLKNETPSCKAMKKTNIKSFDTLNGRKSAHYIFISKLLRYTVDAPSTCTHATMHAWAITFPNMLKKVRNLHDTVNRCTDVCYVLICCKPRACVPRDMPAEPDCTYYDVTWILRSRTNRPQCECAGHKHHVNVDKTVHAASIPSQQIQSSGTCVPCVGRNVTVQTYISIIAKPSIH